MTGPPHGSHSRVRVPTAGPGTPRPGPAPGALPRTSPRRPRPPTARLPHFPSPLPAAPRGERAGPRLPRAPINSVISAALPAGPGPPFRPPPPPLPRAAPEGLTAAARPPPSRPPLAAGRRAARSQWAGAVHERGRVRAAPIGWARVWERRRGTFHTSRARAARAISRGGQRRAAAVPRRLPPAARTGLRARPRGAALPLPCRVAPRRLALPHHACRPDGEEQRLAGGRHPRQHQRDAR